MAEFKVGDRVTLKGDLCSTAKPGDMLTVTSLDGGFVYFTNDRGGACFHGQHEFELIEGGTMDFKVGDVLVNNEGDTCKVLGYFNQGIELWATSGWGKDEFDENRIEWYTNAGMKALNLKLKSDTTVEKSVADIEKELGLSTGTLRIKKDD